MATNSISTLVISVNFLSHREVNDWNSLLRDIIKSVYVTPLNKKLDALNLMWLCGH